MDRNSNDVSVRVFKLLAIAIILNLIHTFLYVTRNSNYKRLLLKISKQSKYFQFDPPNP